MNTEKETGILDQNKLESNIVETKNEQQVIDVEMLATVAIDNQRIFSTEKASDQAKISAVNAESTSILDVLNDNDSKQKNIKSNFDKIAEKIQEQRTNAVFEQAKNFIDGANIDDANKEAVSQETKTSKSFSTSKNWKPLTMKLFIWFAILLLAISFAFIAAVVLNPSLYVNSVGGMLSTTTLEIGFWKWFNGSNTLTSMGILAFILASLAICCSGIALWFNKIQRVFGKWGFISICILVIGIIAFIIIGSISKLDIATQTTFLFKADVLVSNGHIGVFYKTSGWVVLAISVAIAIAFEITMLLMLFFEIINSKNSYVRVVK